MLTTINAKGEVIRHKTRSENVQIIRTLAVIVILFMACMLPNQIAWLLFDFGGDSYKELSDAFWTCAEALIYLHACVNSIVYGSLTRQFRRGYVRFFRHFFCFGKINVDYSTGVSENHTRDKHLLRRTQAKETLLKLAFTNLGMDTSDDDSCQETKL